MLTSVTVVTTDDVPGTSATPCEFREYEHSSNMHKLHKSKAEAINQMLYNTSRAKVKNTN